MSVCERAKVSPSGSPVACGPSKRVAPDQRSLVGLALLFAVDSRFPAVGGAESQALKLAVALRERGAHVQFVCPRVLRSQPLHETFDGFSVDRVDYLHVRWLGSLVLMINFARYLMRARGRYGAVHVHITHLLAASAGFVRPWSGLRVLTKISGFYEFQGGVLDTGKRFRPLNALLLAGLKRVDLVQTISEQTRTKLHEAGIPAERILCVPNGIDTREAGPPSGDARQSAALRIGYCGRLREVKGVHVLLDAFAGLVQAQPRFGHRLIIAGDGTQGEALKAQAHALGVSGQVDWLGMIDDTLSFMAGLDVYVQPSFAEGLPNSVMEAMVSRRAVVASDIGGNSDLVTDRLSGLLVPPGDAHRLAEALIRLQEDPSLRQRLGDAGRSVIEQRYAIDAVVDRLVEAYRA